jgi:hypothetical protein
MTKISSVTLIVQFNFVVRLRTIIGFSRKTVIYKCIICFELQTTKLSATVSHCDTQPASKRVFKFNERKPWYAGKSVEAPAGPALPCKRHLLTVFSGFL